MAGEQHGDEDEGQGIVGTHVVEEPARAGGRGRGPRGCRAPRRRATSGAPGPGRAAGPPRARRRSPCGCRSPASSGSPRRRGRRRCPPRRARGPMAAKRPRRPLARRGVAIEPATISVIGRTEETGTFGSSSRTAARSGPASRSGSPVAFTTRLMEGGREAGGPVELGVGPVELLLDGRGDAVVAHVGDDAHDRHPGPGVARAHAEAAADRVAARPVGAGHGFVDEPDLLGIRGVGARRRTGRARCAPRALRSLRRRPPASRPWRCGPATPRSRRRRGPSRRSGSRAAATARGRRARPRAAPEPAPASCR